MDYKDYYEILGVSEDADTKTIKKAFRKLAREYHPDMNSAPEAEQRFKEINEAYEVLSDEEKREKYDQLRHNYRHWQTAGGPSRGGFDWSQWMGGQPGGRPGGVHVEYGGSMGDFSDFFQAIFGGMAGQSRGGGMGGLEDLFGGVSGGAARQRMRGRDLRTDVTITLREAYQGTTRTFSKDGRRLQVKIPRGARTGTKVRIAGEGAEGAGQAGDLYLHVKVQDDNRYTRKGDDLYIDVTLDLYTAVLGGEIDVPTMTGSVTLKINPGTQPGQLIRLRGKGMPKLRESEQYGDLYVRVDVQLPSDLTARERELFEQLASLDGHS